MKKYIVNKNFMDFEGFLLDIRGRFAQGDSTIHKARNELKIIKYHDRQTVVKSFKTPHLLNRFIYTFFRDTKAKKSYEYSLRLGDFTPKPIGYIEFYSSYLFKDSYFVSEKFEYDFTIREPLLDDNFEDKQNILKAFARFTFDLHNAGIFHHDYSPGNILIKKTNLCYEFKVVDINRMKFYTLDLDDRLKNFSKLWMSDTDMTIVASEYARLIGKDKTLCIDMAIKYSHKLKNKINMKKRLKGIEVVD
jgi:hypothetical protein